MLTNWLGAIFKTKAAVLPVILGLCGPALAQQVSFSLLQPASIEPNPMVKSVEPVTLPEAPSHRFWDHENTILFATGEAVGVVAVSYLFHKTGHHKLERAVSMLNIGSSASAVTFDLLHH